MEALSGGAKTDGESELTTSTKRFWRMTKRKRRKHAESSGLRSSLERNLASSKGCPSPKSRTHLKSITYEEAVSHVPWMTFRGRGVLASDRHSSDRLSAGPLCMRIYARSTRTGLALLGSSFCTESIIVFTPTPPDRPVFGPRLKFWRTTALRAFKRGNRRSSY